MVILFNEEDNTHNNDFLNYHNSINFAINLHNTLLETELPPHWTLRQYPYNEDHPDVVIVDFVHPNTDLTGHVMLSRPAGNGFVHMLFSIDRFNGYEITVNSFQQMLEVIAFSQNLLQFQPNQLYMNYIRVPQHLNYVWVPQKLLNHWCVPNRLRELNLRHYDEHIVVF